MQYDAGRGSGAGSRWILKIAGNKKPVKRLWISSVTDKAIREGFKNLKDGRAYLNLYAAAEARAEADWLGGDEWNKGIDMSLQCTAFLWPRSDTDISIDCIQRAGDQILCA